MIYQNVTIGGNTKSKDGKITNIGAPYIKANTIIYSVYCCIAKFGRTDRPARKS